MPEPHDPPSREQPVVLRTSPRAPVPLASAAVVLDQRDSVAIVKVEEGPTMMTNIVNCPQTPESLILDMPLRVLFVAQNDEITLPFFEPVDVV